MDSSATYNFVTQDFVQKLGVTSVMDAALRVTLADRSVVSITQAVTLHLQLYDDRGHLIPSAYMPVTCHILEVMPAPVMLGMPWLQEVNPKMIGLCCLCQSDHSVSPAHPLM